MNFRLFIVFLFLSCDWVTCENCADPELINCPSGAGVRRGYIMAGSTVTCGCRSHPEGSKCRPQWTGRYDNERGFIDQFGNAIVNITFNYWENDAVYTCISRSNKNDDNPSSVSYRPTFAYGPEKMDLEIWQNPKYPSCKPVFVQGNCNVKGKWCHPPVRNIRLEAMFDGEPVQRKLHPSSFNLEVLKTTNVTIICSAENSVFPELKAEAEESILVTVESPFPIPTMTITGHSGWEGKKALVKNGQRVTVNCGVSKDYQPEDMNVMLECLRYRDSRHGLESSVSFVVESDQEYEKCTCVVSSKCQRQTADLTLKVKKSISVTHFTANEESESLEVTEGDKVTFCCEAVAEGIREDFEFTIKGLKTKRYISLDSDECSSRDFGRYYQQTRINSEECCHTKTMKCRETDTYVCTLDDVDLGKNVTVFVKCPPRLHSRDKSQTMFSCDGCQFLTIEILISAYPPPKDFVLWRITNHPITTKPPKNSKVSAASYKAKTEVDRRHFNVSFKPTTVSSGIVMVTLWGMKNDDSGQFVLDIVNGAGQNLSFTFNLVINHIENEINNNDGTAAAVGWAVSIVLVIIIVIAVVVLVLYRRKKKAGNGKEHPMTTSQGVNRSYPSIIHVPAIPPRPLSTTTHTNAPETDSQPYHYYSDPDRGPRTTEGSSQQGNYRHSYIEVLSEPVYDELVTYDTPTDCYENVGDSQQHSNRGHTCPQFNPYT